MNYSVEPWIFEKNPDVLFGVVVGRGLANSASAPEDVAALAAAQDRLASRYTVDDLKAHEDFAVYRTALQNLGINANKFTHSVEAMAKRVLKGGRLPAINALVDLCNVISLEEAISLGGHDLRDIHDDLRVGRAGPDARYLPLGETDYEAVPADELVFTSGTVVQTRQWLWRQSELGKMTRETTDVFFQLVGFGGVHAGKLDRALDRLEALVAGRFGGTATRFLVSRERQQIGF